MALAQLAQLAQPAPLLELDAVTALVIAGNLDSAESELKRIVDVAESAAARDLLGLVLVRRGRAEEAEREFLRAVELSPEFFPARRNLGRLYLQQRRAGEALRELRAAARLAPLERELAFQLAVLEFSQGHTSAGESQLRSITERLDSVRAMLELARSLARRGENQEALEQLKRALDLAPNSEDVLSAYARVLLAVQAPVPAVDTLKALTRMHPAVAAYPYLLGVAQLQIAETTDGIESLERSLELEPRQALPLIGLGLAFKHQKRFAEAKEVLVQGLQLMPGNVDALIALAEAEEGLGELQLAEQHVKRTLELAEDAPVALYVLGKIRMAEGRYDEARDALHRSVEQEPTLAKAHYQLSLAYARLRDRESSQRHLELYRQALKEEEERLIELRTAAGLGVGGMGRGG